MIPNQWYVVLSSSELGDRPLGVLRLGEHLVFWRDSQGAAHCFEDRCAHRGIQLCLGQVLGDRLQCPFHGFEYDAQGKVQLIPANGRSAVVSAAFRVRSYPTHESRGFIWIWWGERAPSPAQPPFFTDLDASFSYAEVRDPWKAHYSRVIENQLDVVHVPFIHYNTIGRGGRTLVDGPGLKWISPDMFHVYVFNRLDDGRPAVGPREVPLEPEPPFKLEFIFPNLWENHIGPETRIVAAFVPVDATHTILYLRFYQKFMQVPVLRTLVNWLAMPFNIYVAHQDRRVVETHEPAASALRMGEQLIRGDYPIIEYRRRREELKSGQPPAAQPKPRAKPETKPPARRDASVRRKA
jgi:phenylpropionate dioxygenase-like ring-hydroxylating dioxygenase large terminal subunit